MLLCDESWQIVTLQRLHIVTSYCYDTFQVTKNNNVDSPDESPDIFIGRDIPFNDNTVKGYEAYAGNADLTFSTT